MDEDMTKVTYYQIGSGLSVKLARVRDHEYAYLDEKSGQWVEHPSVVDCVHTKADTFEITLDQAKALVRQRVSALWEEELDNLRKKSTKIDFTPFTLRDSEGKEYTYEDYHDGTPESKKMFKNLTHEQEYSLVMPEHPAYLRNLAWEKDLDLSKIDKKLLKRAKVAINEDGKYTVKQKTRRPMRVRYYQMGSGQSANVARVKGHEYAYLDHKTGAWVEHASVCDSVTGYGGDADTFEITLEQAQQIARLRGVNVGIEWLPDGD
jgi:hypothetical protein